jgi:SAM-dependent methyltransferase
MQVSEDLKHVSTHFEFGENWRSYAELIDESAVTEAVKGLTKLVPSDEWVGKRVLDIGSGSGLHALAAFRLGAADVVAMDIDESSVSTTRQLLSRHVPNAAFETKLMSVFDATPADLGVFDIVYSWGVLHHTGDMWTAIEKAAALVKEGGVLVIALYQRRVTCNLWTAEKRFYTKSGGTVRRLLRGAYAAVLFTGLAATGRNPVRHVREYKSKRGMSLWHDIHDWMGGFPYESSSPEETVQRVTRLGLVPQRLFPLPPRVGLLGTGCAEYVFRRERHDKPSN